MVNKTDDLSDFEKFANVRLLYLLQFGYPQKKLLFMGQEFGQKNEWNAEEPLPWDVHLGPSAPLAAVVRQAAQRSVQATSRPCTRGTTSPTASSGSSARTTGSTSWPSFATTGDYRDLLVYLLNLSQEHFPEFRLGVPFAGQVLQGARHRRAGVRRQRP